MSVMERGREQLGDDVRQDGGQIGHHLLRRPMSAHRGPKEPAGRPHVASLGKVDVDDLTVLVHGPVDIAPSAADLHLGFVHQPAVAHRAAAGSGCPDQQGREVLHPPIHGHVIDLDPAFGQDLLQVALGQTEPHIPAHRQPDHLSREPVAGKTPTS
jgi:hypothetical protein